MPREDREQLADFADSAYGVLATVQYEREDVEGSRPEGSILCMVGRHLIGPGAVLVAVVALAGCAGTQSAGGGAVPYPGGFWPASDQGAFMGACSAVADATYCACALGDVMQQHPHANDLHGSRRRGTTAATSQQPFPDCADQ